MEIEWIKDIVEEKKLLLDKILIQKENNLVKRIVDMFQDIYENGRVYSKSTINGIKIKYKKSQWSLDRRILAEIDSYKKNKNNHSNFYLSARVYCYAQNEYEFSVLKQLLANFHREIGFPPNVNVKIINYKDMKVVLLNNKAPPKKVNPAPN